MPPPLLFEPAALRNLQLRNRSVVSPMCQYSATDGCANDWHTMHLGTLACSGAGLVIIEATGVEPAGRISPGCLGLYDAASAAVAMMRGSGVQREAAARNGGGRTYAFNLLQASMLPEGYRPPPGSSMGAHEEDVSTI